MITIWIHKLPGFDGVSNEGSSIDAFESTRFVKDKQETRQLQHSGEKALGVMVHAEDMKRFPHPVLHDTAAFFSSRYHG